MSDSIIKAISAFVLSFVVIINAFGNLIGIGDIIPTQPAEEETTATTTVVDITDAEAAEDFIAFFNEETAKIVNNGSYSYNRYCEYTDPIDVGSATDTLNSIISSISDGEDINSVVGGFLGIGTKTGEHPRNYLDSNYAIKASTLKASDLISFSYEDGVYSFTLANTTNPKKTGETSLSRFTNDFITHEEVVDDIAKATTAITVKDSNVDYTNIKVSVKVADGKIIGINYSYDFDAQLSLKTIININGTGAARVIASFSDIEY